MTLYHVIRLHSDAENQLENLKRRVYVAAMAGDIKEVDRLRPIIRTYEHDISVFGNQIIDFEPIGDSTGKLEGV